MVPGSTSGSASGSVGGLSGRGGRLTARGFVGEANNLAGEYHCNDFSFEEHAREMAPLLALQVGCKGLGVLWMLQVFGCPHPHS